MEHYQIFKPKKWVQPELLDDHALCVNPNAIGFLEKHPERICCQLCLSTNPGAIPFLKKNPEYINWTYIAANPEGIRLIEENLEYIQYELLEQEINETKVFKENHPGLSLIQKRFIEKFTYGVDHNPVKVFWTLLSLNPNAISFLESHMEKVNWRALIYNENALPLFLKHPDKISWRDIGLNPSFVQLIETFNPDIIDSNHWSHFSLSFIEKNLERANCIYLSENYNAIPILKQHPEKICFQHLCMNPNPEAILILEQNLDRIIWSSLSRNPSSFPILEKHIDKINWFHLCRNPNPKAMYLFLQHPDKITTPGQWKALCMNPNAYLLVPIFEQNLEHLDWFYLLEHQKLETFIKKHKNRVNWNCIWYYLKKSYKSIWIMETYGVDMLDIPKYTDESYLRFRRLSREDLSGCPDIFEVDKDLLRMRADVYREELILMAFMPERIATWQSLGYDLDKCI